MRKQNPVTVFLKKFITLSLLLAALIFLSGFNGFDFSLDCNNNGISDHFEFLSENGFPKPFTLAEAELYPTNDLPRAVTKGDFDNDGDLDLAVANQLDNNVSIYLNNGGGGFSFPPSPWGRNPVAVHGQPLNITSADFDDDGDDDLAVANDDGIVSVLSALNTRGRLVFSRDDYDLSNPGFPSSVSSVVAAPIDADDYPDLAATVNSGSTQELVVMRNSDRSPGTFETAEFSRMEFASNQVHSLVAADFDRDGDRDLAVGSSGGRVDVFSNRAGSFPLGDRRNYYTGIGRGIVESIAAADLNNDSYEELVTANNASSAEDRSFSILLNQGIDGSSSSWDGFAVDESRTFDLDFNPRSLDAADLDNDGLIDIALAGDGNLAVLLNKGDETFEPPRTFATGRGARAVIAAKLDRRAPQDLVVANASDNNIAVLLNQSKISRDCDKNGRPDECDLQLSDCNDNGFPDRCDLAATVDFSARTYSDYRSPFGYDPMLAVLDHFYYTGEGADIANGHPDLAVINTWEQEEPRYFRNQGDGSFLRDYFYSFFSDSSLIEGNFMAVGDFSGNDRDDFAVVRNPNPLSDEQATVKIFLQLWAGSSEWWTHIEGFDTIDFASGTRLGRAIAADLNNDGNVDLAVMNESSMSIALFLNDGERMGPSFEGGYFPSRSESYPELPRPDLEIPVRALPTSLIASDLNGDELPELIFTSFSTDEVFVCRNTSSGGTLRFPGCNAFNAYTVPRGVQSGDFNGDGKPDLVVANDYTNHVSILFNRTMLPTVIDFDGPLTVDLGPYSNSLPKDLAIADFDGDGDLDLATANWIPETVSVLLGKVADGDFEADHPFYPPSIFPGGFKPEAIAAVDIDSNDKPDLVVANGNGNITTLFNRSRPAVSEDDNSNGLPDECEG